MSDRPADNDSQSLAVACDLARKQSIKTNRNTFALRRPLRRTCSLAAWLTSVSLLVVAGLRIFWHDGFFVLTWLNAFTRYAYLPAYVSLIWAAWQRRWSLAAVCMVVIGCHLVWLAPDFLRDKRFDAPATVIAASEPEASPTLRIFFANVRVDNDQHAALLEEITKANPDIIVLVEYDWARHLAFKNAPALAPYKYGSGHLQSHIGSVNLFSRVPLKFEVQNWMAGRPVHTVDVALGAQTLRLIGLHAPRPLNVRRYNYDEYWQQMLPLLLSQPGPLAIIGDFNATQHSRVYQQLTTDRLRSAHEDRGRGYATTWPNGYYLVPPIRIDQVLISPEVECVSIREGLGRGSDHKPLIVDLKIRAGANAATQR